MYGKGEKQYQTLKPARGSDTPDNSNFVNNGKTQKRQQLYREDFELNFSQGSSKKNVSVSVEGSHWLAQCIGRQPAFELMQKCLNSHYLSSN